MPTEVRPVLSDNTRDLEAAGRLLHDFNVEYDDVTPGPTALAERLRRLIADGATAVLLAAPDAGAEPVGVAVLRWRPSLWTEAHEAYLAELYVAPAHRGRGLGEALLAAALRHARDLGADYLDLATSEDDVAARSLYEKLGLRRTEGDGGPVMYCYEIEL